MTDLDYLTVGRDSSGEPLLRVRILSALAKIFRIQFRIGGWPYGCEYRKALNCIAEEIGAASEPAGQ